MDEPFAQLSAAARSDRQWDAVHLALGDADTTANVSIAANSVSSSFLPQTAAHMDAAINSAVVASAPTTIRRLDGVFDEYVHPGDVNFLKLDVQGYEMRILEGATGVMDRIVGLQVELSLVPMYEGGPLFGEVVEWAAIHGFALMGLEPGFRHPKTGRLLQVDGVFFREP